MKRTARRSWRRRLNSGRKQYLKKVLTVALILECSYGIKQIQVVTKDRISQIEWVSPDPETEATETDVYGIRFFRETGGFQFYHIHQSIKDH